MKYVMGIMVIAGLLMGAVVEAPPIKAIGKAEGVFPTSLYAPKITPRDTIAQTPDIRTALGTPGKNIAVRGDTVVVIFGPSSGDPTNIFRGVQAGYSLDGGHTWSLFDLSTNQVRRVYPGVIWPEDWNSPLFFWHEARNEGGVYLPSTAYIAWDLAFPNGIFNVVELPNSGDWDTWLPSADASGDTIIVIGANVLTTFLSFIWRSYDHGTTWEADTFLTTGVAGGWHDTPIPRIGHNGYVAVLTDWIVDYGWDAVTPFFLESLDGGQTWIDTINLWDACGWTPYDSAGSWWYTYDFVLDENDKPHIAVKLGAGTYEYGDCWYYSPGGGEPGAWTDWECTLIGGDGQGGNYVTQPTITYDPTHGVLYYALKGFFASGADTFLDIGFLSSTDGGATWIDEGIFVGADEQEEEAFEFPVVTSAGGWTTGLHGSYVDNSDYTFYHAGLMPPPGVSESSPAENGLALSVKNPVDNSGNVRFTLPENSDVALKLFDASGRLVRNISRNALSAGTHELTIGTANLPDGVYVLTIEAGKTSASTRIVVIH